MSPRPMPRALPQDPRSSSGCRQSGTPSKAAIQGGRARQRGEAGTEGHHARPDFLAALWTDTDPLILFGGSSQLCPFETS